MLLVMFIFLFQIDERKLLSKRLVIVIIKLQVRVANCTFFCLDMHSKNCQIL